MKPNNFKKLLDNPVLQDASRNILLLLSGLLLIVTYLLLVSFLLGIILGPPFLVSYIHWQIWPMVGDIGFWLIYGVVLKVYVFQKDRVDIIR